MTLDETMQREEVARLMRDSMSKVLGESGITIHATQYNAWRATQRVHGVVQGIKRAEILATDGNLGIYKSDETFWVGHIGWFSGDVKPLHSLPGQGGCVKPKRAKQVRKSKAQKDLEALGL